MTRLAYTVAQVVLLVAYTIITALLVSAGAPVWTQILALAGLAGCWHAFSARRISEVALLWLHAAPYASLIGLLVGLSVMAQEQAQSAPLPQDAHPIPAWFDLVGAAGFAAALMWPAASIALSILPSRRR